MRPFISRYSRIHVLAHTHTPTGMQEAHIMVFRFETALNNHCDTNATILYPKALQVRSVCWKNTVQTNPISYDTAMQTEKKNNENDKISREWQRLFDVQDRDTKNSNQITHHPFYPKIYQNEQKY